MLFKPDFRILETEKPKRAIQLYMKACDVSEVLSSFKILIIWSYDCVINIVAPSVIARKSPLESSASH